MGVGLLSRLGTGKRSADDRRSIANHLQELLNSRVGESIIALDFGLPDFTDIVHTIPEGVHTVQESLRDVIVKYEPRLCKVSVRFIPTDDPFLLYFEIAARYTDDPQQPFRVRTEMGFGGRFQVN